MIIDAWNLEELKSEMEKNGVNNLGELEEIATLPTSNFGGVVIKTNVSEEFVFVQDVWDSGCNEIEEKEILFNEDGEAYFKYNDEDYKLNEFMRVRYNG